MTRLGQGLTAALTILGVAACVALIGATGLGAVGRYLRLTGVTWSFEVVGILFVWVIAIGTVLSEIAGENVSIDGNTHESGRGPWMRLYHAAVLLTVSGALLWSGRALLARTAFNPTPVLRAPTWIVHSTTVFMGAALAVIALVRILRLVGELRR
ncbi:MAG: TRAP transporter small permease subunit [Amaricoccus sp.]|uniref:TRAP transporter small permease n=1 Tax=Amaricoccus sp. TaxID=1872485 RepID=UPI0039E57209